MKAEKPLRIALYGQFGVGNFGNEGSLAAMLAFLRRARPDAKLVCVCATPHLVEAEHGIEAISVGAPAPQGVFKFIDTLLLKIPHRLLNFVHAYRHAGRFDVMIIPGTGMLDDFATTPFGAPYALYRWCIAARGGGARLAFVSIGAGPIKRRVSRWFMTKAAALAEYRSYRDAQSKDFMLSLGFPAEDDPLYPDIAFALPAPAVKRASGDALTVGVGLMRYVGWTGDPALGEEIYATYIEKISRFVAWLMEQGHKVRLIIGETIDARAIDDVMDAVGPRAGELIIEPADSLGDVMRQIGAVDVVVATRFHNIVCALKMGRPTLSIGYARKNDVLLESAGLGAFCQHIEHLDVERLTQQFKALIADRTRYAAGVDAARREIEARLAEQEKLLLETLLNEDRVESANASAPASPLHRAVL